MGKTKIQRYFVVVVPPTAKPNIQLGQQAQSQVIYNLKPSPVIKTVEATSAQEAAEKAGVPAGGVAHVCGVQYVSKFTRPEKAKLEAA